MFDYSASTRDHHPDRYLPGKNVGSPFWNFRAWTLRTVKAVGAVHCEIQLTEPTTIDSLSIKCHAGMPCQAKERPRLVGCENTEHYATGMPRYRSTRMEEVGEVPSPPKTRRDPLGREVGREARNGNYQLALDRLSER